MTSQKIKKWIWGEQHKHHRCQCGCGQFIKIIKRHYYNGVPKFLHNHFWKGKNHSEETKQKMKLDGRFGRKHIEESLIKMSKAQSGKNHPFYNKKRIEHSKKMSGKKRPEHSKRMKGDNNPSWNGGISFLPYCYKFNKELKTQIKNRDNNICQLCDNKNNLVVHHIHYDKDNCDPDLITLCTSCNFKVNYKRDYWEEYFMRQLTYRGLVKIYNLNEIGYD